MDRSWQETTGGRRHDGTDLGIENWIKHSVDAFTRDFFLFLSLSLFLCISGAHNNPSATFSPFIFSFSGKALAPQTSWQSSCYEISLSGRSGARRWTPLSITKVPSVRLQCRPPISLLFRKRKISLWFCFCVFFVFFSGGGGGAVAPLEPKMLDGFYSSQKILACWASATTSSPCPLANWLIVNMQQCIMNTSQMILVIPDLQVRV